MLPTGNCQNITCSKCVTGIIHNDVKCAGCSMAEIKGIRYTCTKCSQDLCTKCYHSDKHDLSHPFHRINEPGDEL